MVFLLSFLFIFLFFFFFFQAEDGIRDGHVTGVQTCALPILLRALGGALWFDVSGDLLALKSDVEMIALLTLLQTIYYTFMLVLLSGFGAARSEERRVGKECRSVWARSH